MILTPGIAPIGKHHLFPSIQQLVNLLHVRLLLERLAEQICGDTWRNIRADLNRIKLAQLSPNSTVWQITEPLREALKLLQSLTIRNPPPIPRLA